MAKTQTMQNDIDAEREPVESPSTELANILDEGDPDLQLAILEKKATLAHRYAQAVNAILIAHTYPEDWKIFGDGDSAKACLSSAGAERVARQFGIRIFEVKSSKEEFTDTLGKGYRYIFEGKASMADRLIYAQGSYSTRDKFLGYKDGSFKTIEEVNENDIRDAAYHIFHGNAIKALLGLRGIPAARFRQIMEKQGENGDKASNVRHGKGTEGGTTADDSTMQKELAELLIEIANAGWMIVVEGDGSHNFEQTSEISDPMEVAKSSCKALSSFYSKKDKKVVAGIDSAKVLKGQRLQIALANGKKLWAEKQQEEGNGGQQ